MIDSGLPVIFGCTRPLCSFLLLEFTERASSVMSFPEDDVPVGVGISPALLRRLEREDLGDLSVVLRHRGVRTLRALSTMDCSERAILIDKARRLWELLGLFETTLRSSVKQLFDAECFPASAYTASLPDRMSLEPEPVCAGSYVLLLFLNMVCNTVHAQYI